MGFKKIIFTAFKTVIRLTGTMPEGPEVLRITQRLDSGMSDKTLTHIEFHVESYRNKQFRGDPTAVSNFLSELSEGLEVNSVNCKGKFIWFDFGEYEVWHTLGMSGTWRNYWPKRGNVMLSFQFSDGSVWNYKDTRRFGTFRVFASKTGSQSPELIKKLNKDLGPDMLSAPPTVSEFISRFRRKNHWNITKAMMNQKVVAGIGNYIKAEVLYRAKISPMLLVSELSDAQLIEIYEQTCWVIKASYESRGATIRDYVMPDGSVGDYQFKFLCYSQSRCPEKHRIVRHETPDKRTTWWCPECQKSKASSTTKQETLTS
jgi:formamidopyrimidine-DNA glycosylase